MRRLAGCLTTAFMLAACSSASPTFSLSDAAVDPTYFCPGGATNAPYDLHATIAAHNGTTSAVTIQSITAQMTLASVSGDWLEKVGDRYDAESVTFSPDQVAAGASATLKVTIGSACTSGKYGTGVSSTGQYDVTMRVKTSSGSYTIATGNRHEIVGD